MINNIFKMKATVWLYEGMGGWHFATLPKKDSGKIKTVFGDMKRGFGSLKIIAQIGQSKWKTSIFPDNKIGAYVLPIKAEVRKKEKIKAGDTIEFSAEILL